MFTNKLQHPFAPHLNKMHKLEKWSNMEGRGGERIRPNWCASMHVWIICNTRTVLTIWNWNELRNIAKLFMWLSRLWLWIPKNSGYRILHAFIQAVSHRPHLAQRQHHQTTLGQHRCTTVFHGSKSLLKTCFDALEWQVIWACCHVVPQAAYPDLFITRVASQTRCHCKVSWRRRLNGLGAHAAGEVLDGSTIRTRNDTHLLASSQV